MKNLSNKSRYSKRIKIVFLLFLTLFYVNNIEGQSDQSCEFLKDIALRPIEIKISSFKKLKAKECYQSILDILGEYKYPKRYYSANDNDAVIYGLAIIHHDKILKSFYRRINISVTSYRKEQIYTAGYWSSRDFTIIVKTNKFKKSFYYKGKRGGKSESYSTMSRNHDAIINIEEICKTLLSPLTKEDMTKIANESKIIYLQSTAKKMLLTTNFN